MLLLLPLLLFVLLIPQPTNAAAAPVLLQAPGMAPPCVRGGLALWLAPYPTLVRAATAATSVPAHGTGIAIPVPVPPATRTLVAEQAATMPRVAEQQGPRQPSRGAEQQQSCHNHHLQG